MHGMETIKKKEKKKEHSIIPRHKTVQHKDIQQRKLGWKNFEVKHLCVYNCDDHQREADGHYAFMENLLLTNARKGIFSGYELLQHTYEFQ